MRACSILRKRLGELGLPVPPAGGPTPDFYDEPLAAVVKSYQETKGLTVDGVIGTNTTRSLNTSIDDRIEQVVANLERRRWLPEDLGSRYVLVNAGDYSMVFVDGGQRVFESLVIVGTPKDPTPEIQSVMHGFQTNPYWTVPQSHLGRGIPAAAAPRPLCAAGQRLQDLRQLERQRLGDRSRLDRLEHGQSQGLPLPRPPGAGRQQRAGLHLLPVRQQVRHLHARHGEPLAVHRRQPQLQPRLHPAAEPARLRREGVQGQERLRQGEGARGDQRRGSRCTTPSPNRWRCS